MDSMDKVIEAGQKTYQALLESQTKQAELVRSNAELQARLIEANATLAARDSVIANLKRESESNLRQTSSIRGDVEKIMDAVRPLPGIIEAVKQLPEILERLERIEQAQAQQGG